MKTDTNKAKRIESAAKGLELDMGLRQKLGLYYLEPTTERLDAVKAAMLGQCLPLSFRMAVG